MVSKIGRNSLAKYLPASEPPNNTTQTRATRPSLGHPLAHVLVAHHGPHRVVHDVVHDGIGLNAAAMINRLVNDSIRTALKDVGVGSRWLRRPSDTCQRNG